LPMAGIKLLFFQKATIYIDLSHDKMIKTKMNKNIATKRYLATFDFFVLDFAKFRNVTLFGSSNAWPKRNLYPQLPQSPASSGLFVPQFGQIIFVFLLY
jgi:hypothetical protein